MNELEVLQYISSKLLSQNIEYMLSGSVAMSFYTQPRMTRDIDIIIDIQKKDADVLINLFSKKFYIDKEAVVDAVNNNSMFNIIHLESVTKIDFIIRKESEYRKLEFSRRKLIKIDDFELYIVSIEDLIISKLFWAKDSFSERQIDDVKNLIQNKFNKKYVNKWIKRLELEDVYLKALENE